MTAPPPPDDLPDELTEAYRRASEADLRRPDARVRAAVMKKAALAGRHGRSFEGSGIGHWKWKAAASVAAVGLIGILSLQSYRSPSKQAAPAPASGAVSDASAVQIAAQATAPPSEPGAELLEQSPPAVGAAPKPRQVARAAAPVALVPQQPVARSAGAATAAMAAAPAADSQNVALYASSAHMRLPLTATSAQSAASPPPESVLGALRSAHPELFGASATMAVVRVAMVLNGDGSLYKSAIEVPGTAGTQETPIAEELRRSLGVAADELEGFPREWRLAPDQEHAATIVVEVGIRKDTGTATRAH
jgi:hypothetical protein